MFVLIPATKTPVVPKPTVESTVITEDPTLTVSSALVAGVILKFPCIVSSISE